MSDLTATVDLKNVDGLAKSVASELKEPDSECVCSEVPIPPDVIHWTDDSLQEVVGYLKGLDRAADRPIESYTIEVTADRVVKVTDIEWIEEA